MYINFQRQNLGPIRNDVHVAEDLSSHDLSIILNIFGKLPKIISHSKYSILKKNISDIESRKKIPVLTYKNQIAWVPGSRPAEWAKVNEEENFVLHFVISKINESV